MISIESELEARIVEALRATCAIPVVGFFATALEGEMKTTEATSVQVTVSPRSQMYEPHGMYALNVSVSLNVEACESKGGGLFVEEFDAVAGLLEAWGLGDGCTALSTERFDVGGLQQTSGGSLDFDPTVSLWNATWTCTITGCLK